MIPKRQYITNYYTILSYYSLQYHHCADFPACWVKATLEDICRNSFSWCVKYHFNNGWDSRLNSIFLPLSLIHSESDLDALPTYDYQNQVLLFYKYYDPIRRMISYIGHSVEPISRTFGKCTSWHWLSSSLYTAI